MHDPVLVYDIGGTYSRCALYCVDRDKLLSKVRCRTPNYSHFKAGSNSLVRAALMKVVRKLGDSILEERTPASVAVAFPGPINSEGAVLTAPTVWGSADNDPVEMQEHLQSVWPNSKTFLLNDVTAAGFYYLRRPKDDVCVVTVSSGIGNKVFINGMPVVGSGGRGGEIGHIRVDYSDGAPKCDCGGYGHLGALASGRATAWQAQKLFNENPSLFRRSVLSKISSHTGDISNEQIVSAFHDGDDWTRELITRLAKPLARILASIHLSMGVERFVLVGGFALALGEGYRKQVVVAADQAGWNLGENWDAMIELGDAASDAGMVGAGRYASRMLNIGKSRSTDNQKVLKNLNIEDLVNS